MKLQKIRLKSIFISFSFIFVFLVILVLIPFPFSIKANGIILTNDYTSVYLKTDGYLKKNNIKNGDFIKKGELIARFTNKELDYEIESLLASKKETQAYMMQALNKARSDIYAIKMSLDLLEDKIKFLENKKSDLKIVASIDGYFIYENINYRENTWFKLGTKIGMLIPKKSVHFQAVVHQEEAYNLFLANKLDGSIKLHGLNEKTINVSALKIIPYQKQELPSAALGWLGGGDIATSNKDNSGKQTTESFFEVRAEIIRSENLSFLHGRSGILKINLEPRTILQRMVLALKQILQKHYKI